ncbi:ABC transporter permease, partial [Clostridium celatum]
MIILLEIILNTIKLLLKKKSFIVMGILAPAIVLIFFSFAFGNDITYKVGIVDKDNNYISNEIIETINNIEDVDVVDISKDNYEMLLASHQIQIAVIIEDNFSYNILNLKEDKITIKSISNSDVKETLISIIKSKVNNLNLIAKISDKDIGKFKEKNEAYKENLIKYNLNEANDGRPSIENSIGIVIMMILISGVAIVNFLIEDEENNTKERVFISGIKQYKYYIALIIVFYL